MELEARLLSVTILLAVTASTGLWLMRRRPWCLNGRLRMAIGAVVPTDPLAKSTIPQLVNLKKVNIKANRSGGVQNVS